MSGRNRNIEDIYRLSPVQQGILFHSLEDPESGLYVEQLSCVLEGDLDRSAFESAWQWVVDRHSVLRSALVWKGAREPVQAIYRRLRATVGEQDWRRVSEGEQHLRLEALLEEQRKRGFELNRAPLQRLDLVRLAERRYFFLWTFHHVVLDGWSVPVVLEEVFTAYASLRRGAAPGLPGPRPFRDYVDWLRQRDFEAAESYWRRVLRGFSEPTILAGASLPGKNAADSLLSRSFPASSSNALEAFARRSRMTLYTLAQGAMALMLSRYTGRTDVLFGATTSGRPPELRGVERMVGLFINTLPVRVHVPGPALLRDWLGELQARQAEQRDHEHTPLTAVQAWSELPTGTPLFENLLVLENYPVRSKEVADLSIRDVRFDEKINYPWTVNVISGPPLEISVQYQSDRFHDSMVVRFLDQMRSLLDGFVLGAERPLEELSILSPAERHQLTVDWNDTARPPGAEGSFYALFESQVSERPDKVAAVCAEVAVSYGELRRRARRLACRLVSRGVGPESVVALLGERGLGFLTAILGVFEAGGAYMPLDPSHPGRRHRQILKQSRAVMVLAEEQFARRLGQTLAEALPGERAPVLVWEPLVESSETDAIRLESAPSHLAYVIFTSGSTGLPKGAMLDHRGFMNHLWAMVEDLGIDSRDRIAQNAPQCFDISVWQFLCALMVGGEVHIAPEAVAREPRRLLCFTEEHRITMLEAVPSMVHGLLETAAGDPVPPDLGSLRWLVVTGEACPRDLCERWLRAYPSQPVMNAYGPTECSDDVTSYVAREAPAGPAADLAIGRPLVNTQVFTVDRGLRPMPIETAGELVIAGTGVGRGYLDDPARTAEVFVPNPFAGEPGRRLYRTGDLARRLSDGVLDFLGRIDHQVKLRGFRIELGEIGTVLAEHPLVERGVALVSEQAGTDSLVAYVVTREAAAPRDLREFLSDRLPPYMVPSAFVFLDELPLTPNGKLDRAALERYTPAEAGEVGEAFGQTPFEELVAGVFTEILRSPRIGPRSDFFELGGHSLLAMQLVSRLRGLFGVELPIRKVFEASTVAALAAEIERRTRRTHHGEAPPIEPAARERTIPWPGIASGRALVQPLSFAQQRLWFLDQLDPGRATYNLPAAVRLTGEPDLAALDASLAEIVRRHETLRTVFATMEDEPVQVILPPEPAGGRRFPVVDLSDLPGARRRAESERLATEEARRPFDLARGPLLRTVLLALDPEDHMALFSLHHIISDGWSDGVLLRELGTLYEGFVARRPASLPALPVQYADFAVWQRLWLQGAVLERELEHWKSKLASPSASGEPLRVLELPSDRPRPTVPTYHGLQRNLAFARQLSSRLESLSRSRGVTLFMTLMAAFQALMSRTTGLLDIAVGTPIAGRNQDRTEGLIGFFVNALVLRTELAGDPTFGDLLKRVCSTCLEAYAHQDLPFEKIVEELQPERDLRHTPFFQVVFGLQNTPAASFELPGLTLERHPVDPGTSRFDLTLLLEEATGGLLHPGAEEAGLVGVVEYNRVLFDTTTVERLIGHLRIFLESVAEDPEQRLSDVEWLSPGERAQLVREWNDTAAGNGAGGRLEELFTAQARRTPEAPAVIGNGVRWSYRELELRARRLAHHLRDSGVGPGSRVGVHLDRSPDMVSTLLGILMAGGAYVPLETRYPEARIRWILETMEIGVVVAGSARAPAILGLAADLPALVHLVCPDWTDAPPRRSPGLAFAGQADLERRRDTPVPTAEADDLAYVIFTSGSTGTPKGVMVRHSPVINLIEWVNRTCRVGPGDRVLFITSLGFDLSVYDVFGLLAAGGSIRVADDSEVGDAEALARVLADEPITFWDSAPAALQQLVPFLPAAVAGRSETALERVFLSGDWIPLSLPGEVRKYFPGARVISLGGATEATVWSNFHRVGAIDPSWKSIPYGRPIENARYHVLDPWLGPSPIGVAGDLFIGGKCLSSGYAARPGLTADRYLPDPYAGHRGAVMYRTGDRARFFAGGVIEFLGRLDHQVKIRGFRIELGEVETVLSDHPEVREALALVRHEEARGAEIVAYAVPAAGAREDAAGLGEELTEHLRQHLPEYMVPAALVFLESLPVTPNGKLDRAALLRLAPSSRRQVGAGKASTRAAPRTPIEQLLVETWAQVLGAERVGIHDDFFELGGHSLLATRVVTRVREALGVELALRRFFEHSTPATLAELLAESAPAVASPIEILPRGGTLPLSFAQERLWFLHQLDPASPAYTIAVAVEIRGDLDAAALDAGWKELVRRHESLRTRFTTRDGEPAAVVETEPDTGLPRVDLSALETGRRRRQARRLARRTGRHAFDLETGPLRSTALATLAANRHILLLAVHHIVSDGWSMSVLLDELSALYEAARTGQASPLPAIPIQYADFAGWQRRYLSGDVAERELAYWSEQLAGLAPVLELPFDRPRPAVRSGSGAQGSFAFPEQLTSALRKLGRHRGATLFMTLLGAFQLLLGRLTARSDVALGTPVSGRHRPETEKLIGLFVNTLVLRTSLAGDPSFEELLDEVRETALGAFAHQDLPFEKLVEEIRPERDTSHSPLFQVMFGLQNVPLSVLRAEGCEFELADVESGSAKFDLTFFLEEDGETGGLEGIFEYDRDLFDAVTVRRLAGHYRTLLENLAAAPQSPLSQVPWLRAPERHQLLKEWNDTRTGGPGPFTSVVDRFEARARRHPETSALCFGDREICYRDLESRANRLARFLRGRGVGPDSRVGVALERSPEMVAAVLGIMKAGGAYVPVDPTHPPSRLGLIVEDAQTTLLLTRESWAKKFPPGPQRVLLEAVSGEIGGQSDEALTLAIDPEALAYMIYTSGSTGRPKGVMVTHRGLANYLDWCLAAYPSSPGGRVPLHSSLAFDMTVTSLFAPLLTGSAVELFAEEAGMGALEEALRARGEIGAYRWVKMTPAHLEMLGHALAPEELGGRADALIFGGEALRAESLAAWRTHARETRLINEYGPTEAVVGCSVSTVTENDPARGAVPIGRPIRGMRLHLADPRLEPLPVGVPGEILIGGVALARGYFDRPGLSAEKFVPDPFGGGFGGRLYRTGDLARTLADGRLEFLGRRDHQVKLRGVRIELGEIEATLARHPGVREAVVLAREDTPGDQRLTAYVTASSAAEPPAAAVLRRFLEDSLPDYMVPAACLVLDAMPLAPSGKVERKALPAPDPEPEKDYEAPVGPVEAELAEIWREVLHVPRVGRNDHFFELGGHSLLLAKVRSRLEERFERKIPMLEIFQRPVVSSLAEYLVSDEASGQEAFVADVHRSARLEEGKDRFKQRLRQRQNRRQQ